MLYMATGELAHCKSKAIANKKNAIVASCWTYFTTINHDAWNHKY